MEDRPLHWYVNAQEGAGTIHEWPGSKDPRGYTPFVQAAVRACATLTDPPITSADSLRALKTVFSIYAAAGSGRATKV
jgi:predicted dehydrogenase